MGKMLDNWKHVRTAHMQHSTASTPMPGSRKLKSADLRTSLTYYARVLHQKLGKSRVTKEDDSWGDEEELVVRALPSKYRSANVGHFAQLLLKSRRLDGISFYHILSTNHLTSIKGLGGWDSLVIISQTTPPSNHSTIINTR